MRDFPLKCGCPRQSPYNGTLKRVCLYQQSEYNKKEACKMKGYYVSNGYMGYVDGVYRLFADESDYLELMRDENDSAA